MKKILVCGAGGFIGHHLVKVLKKQGNYVIGVDLRFNQYELTSADEFIIQDLRDSEAVKRIVKSDIDEIYQLAADMGGAGYIFTGNNDADIMHNSAQINLNLADSMIRSGVKNIFYTSSACIYPAHNQEDPNNPLCSEPSAYPANPDSNYGWEKLFSERMWLSYAKNYGLRVRIARLHNVFGPFSEWRGGREKAPTALCRKIAESISGGEIEVWGPGVQTRSFLYIDECIEGIQRIMKSDYDLPLNLGSNRMISINDLVLLISKLIDKPVKIKNIQGPLGVMGRNSDNTLISQVLNWAPQDCLEQGLILTYRWIEKELSKEK